MGRIGGNENYYLEVIDRKIGLPVDLFPNPMPDNMIPGPGSTSNVTLIKKTIPLKAIENTN